GGVGGVVVGDRDGRAGIVELFPAGGVGVFVDRGQAERAGGLAGGDVGAYLVGDVEGDALGGALGAVAVGEAGPLDQVVHVVFPGVPGGVAGGEYRTGRVQVHPAGGAVPRVGFGDVELGGVDGGAGQGGGVDLEVDQCVGPGVGAAPA